MLESASGGGGCLPGAEGVSVWSGGRGVSALSSGVCLVRGGGWWWWCLIGGCLIRGMGGVCLVPGGSACSRGGVCLVQGGSAWSRGDPLMNRMTDRCKNITLATTSLRPVMIHTNREMTDFSRCGYKNPFLKYWNSWCEGAEAVV